MDRAIERQRIVLQHLKPSFSSSSLENLDSSISVSSISNFDFYFFWKWNLNFDVIWFWRRRKWFLIAFTINFVFVYLFAVYLFGVWWWIYVSLWILSLYRWNSMYNYGCVSLILMIIFILLIWFYSIWCVIMGVISEIQLQFELWFWCLFYLN